MVSLATDTAEAAPDQWSKAAADMEGLVRDEGVGATFLMSANGAGELLAGALSGLILNR